MGSAVFNILVIIGLSGMFAGQVEKQLFGCLKVVLGENEH